MDTVLAQVSWAMLHALGDLVTFPWWWYTHGLVRVVRWAQRTIRGWERVVGLRLWARSLFVPMFGQTDWQGRLVSFGMRLAVLVGRILQVLVGAVVVLGAVLLYVLLPLIAVALVVVPFAV